MAYTDLLLSFAVHPVLAACLLGWLAAQLTKVVITSIHNSSWNPKDLVADGGMPSSHVALMAALSAAILLTDGVELPFVISLALGLIVARDAIGVRRAVGHHSKLFPKHKKAMGRGEGHTLAQIIVGAVLGVLISVISIQFNFTILYMLQISYLMLPGILATMAPVLIRYYIKSMGLPIDVGKSLRGNRIFGDTKTVLGFVSGVIVAILVVDIQTRIYSWSLFADLSLIPYADFTPYLVGIVIGIGVMGGDLIKSFIKRRLGFRSGAHFFPWDQLDGTIGAIILGLIFYPLPILVIVFTLFFALVYHLLINSAGVLLGIKKQP